MNVCAFDSLSRPREALLSLGIAAALAMASGPARSSEPLMKSRTPAHPTAPHQVTNCNSSGVGSLSAVIADAGTMSGDVVDLTPLKLVCSRISVQSIDVHQDDLTLEGPGAKYLTIARVCTPISERSKDSRASSPSGCWPAVSMACATNRQ